MIDLTTMKCAIDNDEQILKDADGTLMRGNSLREVLLKLNASQFYAMKRLRPQVAKHFTALLAGDDESVQRALWLWYQSTCYEIVTLNAHVNAG